jgi:hypothetical protein
VRKVAARVKNPTHFVNRTATKTTRTQRKVARWWAQALDISLRRRPDPSDMAPVWNERLGWEIAQDLVLGGQG